jgi:hypothetical protein
MNVGMMWFDNDQKKSMAVKVAEAAKYYYEKYGKLPTTCLVNPGMLLNGDTMVSVIAVKPLRSIMPNNFWIGVEERIN